MSGNMNEHLQHLFVCSIKQAAIGERKTEKESVSRKVREHKETIHQRKRESEKNLN